MWLRSPRPPREACQWAAKLRNTAPESNLRVSIRRSGTRRSSRGKNGVPAPRITGWTTSRYSSTRPRSMNDAARVGPPTTRSPENSCRMRVNASPTPSRRSRLFPLDGSERPREHDLWQRAPEPGELAHRRGRGHVRFGGGPVRGHQLVRPSPIDQRVQPADLVVEPRVELVVDLCPVERVIGRLDVPVERRVQQIDKLPGRHGARGSSGSGESGARRRPRPRVAVRRRARDAPRGPGRRCRPTSCRAAPRSAAQRAPAVSRAARRRRTP